MGAPNGYNTIPDFQYFHSILAGARTLGSVFYVDSGSGVDGAGYGASPTAPFDSIDYAVGQCTADNGDIIIVLPGHAETLTNTNKITVDVAGVTVVGLGTGSLMPTLSHNHADAEVSIAADNVTWMGIRHLADVTDVKVAIEIENGIDYCIVKGCVFGVVTTTTDEFLVSVRTNDASNFATIEDCEFDMGLGAAVAAISFTADTDGTKALNNRIEGDYSTACIQGITTLSTKLLIKGNILVNGGSNALNTEPGIQLLTGSTGIICDNYIVSDLATLTLSVVADACGKFNNYCIDATNETGGLVGTASTDG